MLDDPAIHVGDVHRSVGRIRDEDWTEAFVGGGQELAAGIRFARGHAPAVVFDDQARHQVGGGLGDEHVSVDVRRQTIAAIDERPADRGELGERPVGAVDAGLIGAVGPGIRTHRPDDVEVFVAGGEAFVAPAGPHQVRVTGVVGGRDQVDVHRGLVGVPVNPTGVVLRDAPLTALQRAGDLECAVLQAELHVGLTGGVEPVVERPHEAVRVVLRIALEPAELTGDQLLGIHLQVAGGVLHQPEVRRLGDEHAPIQHLDRAGEHQPIREDRPLVHASVAVGVLQDDNPADWLVLVRPGQIGHESRHLDRPEPAVDVPVERHRLLYQRFAGDELDAVAGRHVKGLHRRLRRQRRRLRRHRLHRRRPRPRLAVQPGFVLQRGARGFRLQAEVQRRPRRHGERDPGGCKRNPQRASFHVS